MQVTSHFHLSAAWTIQQHPLGEYPSLKQVWSWQALSVLRFTLRGRYGNLAFQSGLLMTSLWLCGHL